MAEAPVDARRFAWEKALRGSSLPSIAKHVGLTIATYGDADGTNLRPGAVLLAEATSTSESTVRRGLRALVDEGFLIRVSGGRKAPGRARDHADEYRLSLPTTGGHTDYQSHGLPVTESTDCQSHSPSTGSHSDYPPEPDQIKTSSATTDPLVDVPVEHRDAVTALLARHPGQVTQLQAARCAADVARRNKPRDLARYVRALPLDDVLVRATREPAGTTRAPACSHGVSGGALVHGVGAAASRICDRCEHDDPAEQAATVPVAAASPGRQLEQLETEAQPA